MELIPCIFSLVSLSVDQLVNIRLKMKQQDPSVMSDLLSLVNNIKKYKKKDRRIIIDYVKLFLEENISLNNSFASLEIPEPKKNNLP